MMERVREEMADRGCLEICPDKERQTMMERLQTVKGKWKSQ